MYQNQLPEKQREIWLAAAVAAPLAQTAAGCSWPVAALLGCFGVLLSCLIAGEARDKWTEALRSIWSSVVIWEMLYWSADCWPGQWGRHGVLILLVLAVWAADSGAERPARAGCVLFWPVATLFGVVLASGIPEIRWENLRPVWYLPDGALLTVMLIPMLHAGVKGKAGGKIPLGMAAVGILFSVVTVGVLSYKGIGENAAIYELSRSLRLLGVGERLESLIAAALTIGYFCTMTYLLRASAYPKRRRTVWVQAMIPAVLYIANLRLNSWYVATGSLVFWVLIPGISGLLNEKRKVKKSENNT